MVKISHKGKGKTLYVEISVYPCGAADPRKNLTISCSDKDTQFKTTLSDYGLQKFREHVLSFYEQHILNRSWLEGKKSVVTTFIYLSRSQRWVHFFKHSINGTRDDPSTNSEEVRWEASGFEGSGEDSRGLDRVWQTKSQPDLPKGRDELLGCERPPWEVEGFGDDQGEAIRTNSHV